MTLSLSHAGMHSNLRFLRWLLTLCSVTTVAMSFPPAPNYTLFGIVRDQMGMTLVTEGAEIVLSKDGKEIGRSSVSTAVVKDRNYEINVLVDSGFSSTRLYDEKAVFPAGLFSLAVSIDGQMYYPIEVQSALQAGKGGERLNLDLTLGEDLNGDGLPDAWQQWQLYQNGIYPDANGWNYSLIGPKGDINHDGTTNYQKYLSGTYAADPTQRFELALKSLSGGIATFEFYAITTKTYNIEQSTDLKVWTPLPFSVTPNGERSDYYQATSIGATPAYATISNNIGPAVFFRLTVR